MADFVVDPDGNVKDCRTWSAPPSPPSQHQYPDGFQRFGHEPPTFLPRTLQDYLGLIAMAVVAWVIFGGICWMVTGEWPTGHGARSYPGIKIPSVPPPPPPQPPRLEPAPTWPPMLDPQQGTRPPAQERIRELLERPSHLGAAGPRSSEGDARLPSERGP